MRQEGPQAVKRIIVPSPTKALAVAPPPKASKAIVPSASLTEEQRTALRERIRTARSDSTWKQYASQWSMFEKWCESRKVVPLEANEENVALYLHELAGTRCAYSTVNGHRAALSAGFDTAGREPNPTWHPLVKGVVKAIRRDLGVAARNPKAAATEAIMHKLISSLKLDQPLKAARDRALLLTGWMGAFRRAALVALKIADLKCEPLGYAVTVRKDKSDQIGRGLVKWIPVGNNDPLDAAAAIREWLRIYQAELNAGGTLRPEDPLFPRLANRFGDAAPNVEDRDGEVVALKPGSVALVIKDLARRAGIDEQTALTLSGHSLRAGFITEASLRGATDAEIMQQSGHASPEMIARYRRTGTPQLGNAAMRFGRKP
jgi:integrase